MNYTTYIAGALDFADKYGATFVDIETDDGISRETINRAMKHFHELAPGEAFTLLAIHFDNN
jgi:hypothetical protein